MQKPFLKYQHHQHAGSDGGIGQVEHRLKKAEGVSTHYRHPRRPGALHDREVKHIHYLPVKQRRIALSPRCEVGYAEDAFRENHSVENGINQVARGAGQDEGAADDEAARIALPHQSPQDEETGHHGCQPEECKEELAPIAVGELHAEGHAFVFDKK